MIKPGTICYIVCDGVLDRPPNGEMCEVKAPPFLIFKGVAELAGGGHCTYCTDACLKPIIDPPSEALKHEEHGRGIRELVEGWDDDITIEPERSHS